MADDKESAATSTPSLNAGLQAKIYTIGGVRILFPCQAYPSQMAIMDKIVRGIQRTQNCLLESPTGSGKTLALLCGVLAWQRQERETRENEARQLTNENEKSGPSVSSHPPEARKDCAKLEVPSSYVGSGLDKAGFEGTQDATSIDEQWEDAVDEDLVYSTAGQKRRADFLCKLDMKKKKSLLGKTKSHSPAASPEKLDAQFGIKRIDLTLDTSDSSGVLDENKTAVSDIVNLLKAVPMIRVPKIFFGTRTHKQIAQVVKELSRTEYKNVRMCILSSREHTCIHSSPTISSKNELCHSLLDPHSGPGCLFNNNVSRMATHSALARLGLAETHDIEDLVKLGKKVKSCPYFASRSLMTTADIVFCPYNYLIDPKVRDSLNINLNGAIVVFDEAHNVEDISRESASGTFYYDSLTEAIKDCKTMVEIHHISEEHQNLADYLTKLTDWIDDYGTLKGPDSLLNGFELVGNFERVNIGPSPFETFKQSFSVILSDLREKDLDSGRRNQQKMTINATTRDIIDEIILVFNYLFKENTKEAYHGQLSRELGKSNKSHRTQKGAWMTARNSEPELKWNHVLKISCLDPSVVFKELNTTRSIILSSGTLSPMNTFESELGVQFNHKLEANHVIHPSQVFVSTVCRGPTNINLNAKYANAMTFSFQEELGRLIIEICRTVPHGVLCFLPSYTLMDKLIQRWSVVGILNEMEQHKYVFFEPRNSGQMNDMMADFYKKINATENGFETEDGHRITGCLLIGICRGKISEGIDFTDNDARAVITVGIPFPNITDNRIVKKKEYNCKHAAAKGLLTGDKWYHSQAFRALNQALGRCIRHRNDWGAIILVDERFGSQSNTQGLSKWVRQQVKSYNSWNSFHMALNAFIRNRKAIEALKAS